MPLVQLAQRLAVPARHRRDQRGVVGVVVADHAQRSPYHAFGVCVVAW